MRKSTNRRKKQCLHPTRCTLFPKRNSTFLLFQCHCSILLAPFCQKIHSRIPHSHQKTRDGRKMARFKLHFFWERVYMCVVCSYNSLSQKSRFGVPTPFFSLFSQIWTSRNFTSCTSNYHKTILNTLK